MLHSAEAGGKSAHPGRARHYNAARRLFILSAQRALRCTPSVRSTGRSSTVPPRRRRRRPGLARLRIVGPEQGAVHTDLAAIGLAPGGWLAPHVHSFEEALYVLAGELLLDLGGRVHRLVDGDFALIPTGLRHALGNTARTPARFLSLSSPQRLDPASGAPRHVLRARPGPGADGRRRDPPAVRRPDPPARRPLRRARDRRSRRCGSRIPPAAARPPAPTPRSWPTAGSP